MTHHKAKPGYQHEFDLVQVALQSREGNRKLRAFIEPLVKKIALHFAERYRTSSEELEAIIWRRFDSAVRKYYNRIEQRLKEGKELYRFSTYFSWWALRECQEYTGNLPPHLLELRKQLRGGSKTKEVSG